MPSGLKAATTLLSRYPWVSNPFIVGAPMKSLSGPALAVAVSRAGGLGFIGPQAKTQDTADHLEKAVSLVREARSSFSSSPNSSGTNHQPHLPIGVGYQLWADDLNIASAGTEKHRPCAAWLYAPHSNRPGEYDDWSAAIRRVSPDTQIWIQIGTLKEAKQLLLNTEQPDVVVVQGAESGGHGRARDGMGLMTLFPEIADAFSASEPQIPLLAAGGIADGRGVAAALCLGAAGAVMGTRFLAATEAQIARGYQQEIVRATDGAACTTRTLLYNHLRGTYGWPEEYQPRTIINRSWIEQQQGKSFEELKRLHDELAAKGDAGWGPEGRLATYAGAGVGLVRDVRDAGDIVRGVRAEAAERLRVVSSSLSSSSNESKL